MNPAILIVVLSVSMAVGFGQASSSLVPSAPSNLLAKTNPEYSDEARLAQLEGTVVLAGLVDESGRATDLSLNQSLGLGLDEKAMEAVRQWRFQPGTNSTRVEVDFELPSKPSRWHLIGVDFRPPDGATRPGVVSVYYPSGPGVFGGPAIEEGQLIGAVGRQAFVALSFEIDENGVPVHIRPERSSEEVWNGQAIAVLREWRFTPGMKDGKPVSVPATFDFAWGAVSLGPSAVAKLMSALHSSIPPSNPIGLLPVVLESPDPPYPEGARNAGLEGSVLVNLSVREDGTPADTRVVQGLGTEIDRSVIGALGQWRFRPLLINGQTARTFLTITVQFQLPGRVTSTIIQARTLQPVSR